MTPIMTKAGGFPHGTRASYVNQRCRCEACTEANRTYNREYYRSVRRDAYRPNSLVPADETREHILWLSAEGIGKRRLSELSGVAHSTIWAIRSGEKTKVRRATRDAICAVTVDETSDGAIVDGEQAREVVRRLLDAGWTRYKIAARLGCKGSPPSLQVCRSERVLRRTVRKLQLLEQLHLRGLVTP